jgi:molybdopterin synthase sulfur carrier subunit
MKLKILAFGIAKDIIGAASKEIEVGDAGSIAGLKDVLEQQYPELKKIASYAIAVNNEYASENTAINEHDEIAVIPPVSGG